MENVRVVLEAVESGNFELARRTVDSELLKCPDSDVYLSLKVFTCFRAKDKSNALEAASKAVQFCSKKTLELFLIPVLCDLNATSLLSAAFVRVNRQIPQDNDVTEAWLHVSLLMGDLDSAQKASVAMQRTSKNRRSTTYMACFLMALLFLRHQTSSVANIKSVVKPLGSYSLFPKLAEKMLEKQLPPLNSQECFVAANVRKMTGTRELVDFLQDNIEFTNGSLDLKIMFLEGLEALQEWQRLYDYAVTQLQIIDSFNFYQAMNKASIHLNIPFKLPESRVNGINGLLAQLDWCIRTGKKSDDAIRTCWKKLESKASAFKYLRKYINDSNISILEINPESLGNQLNIYKFRIQQGESLFVPEVLQLYKAHINELPVDKKDYFFGTDALLLIATQFLRSQKDYCRERALVVLEYALQHDPYHFYVKLLLIKIYKSLGIHSEAYKYFESLNVKNVQMESLGYLLSTRIATLCPKTGHSILNNFDNNKRQFTNSGQYISGALFNESYTQFSGIFELCKRLRYSLNQAILVLEKFKLSRINKNFDADLSELQYIGDSSMLCDNRDWNTRFDDGGSNYCESIELGPKQDAAYVEVQKNKELCIQSMRNSTVKFESTLNIEDLPSSLTDVEKWNIHVIDAIHRKSNLTIDVPDAPIEPLDWKTYHWCYTVIETMKVAKQLKFEGISLDGLTYKVRNVVSYHQQHLSNYESKAVKLIQEHNLPGNGSKLVRKIQQQQQKLLKTILDAL